jgi:limonene-1,2-epoxide hydrolase
MGHRARPTDMTPEQTVDEFICWVLAGDLDGVRQMANEYDNVPVGKNIGRQAMKDFLRVMAGMGEVTSEIHRQAGFGHTVMNQRTDRPVAGLFELADGGKVCLWRAYFDYATFERQLAPTEAG